MLDVTLFKKKANQREEKVHGRVKKGKEAVQAQSEQSRGEESPDPSLTLLC